MRFTFFKCFTALCLVLCFSMLLPARNSSHSKKIKAAAGNRIEFQTRKVGINQTATFDFGEGDEISQYAAGFLGLNYIAYSPNGIGLTRLFIASNQVSKHVINVAVQCMWPDEGCDLNADKSFVTVTVIAYLSAGASDDIIITTQKGIRNGTQGPPIPIRTTKTLLLYPFISGFNLTSIDGINHSFRSLSMQAQAQILPGNDAIQLSGDVAFTSDDGAYSDGTLDIGLLAISEDTTICGVKLIHNSKESQEVSFPDDVRAAGVVLQSFNLVYDDTVPRYYSTQAIHLGGDSLPKISGDTVTIPDYASYISSVHQSAINTSAGLVIASRQD